MSSPFNFQSTEWITVFNDSRQELERCYKSLASLECTEQMAQQLRGKIIALRKIIERDQTRFKSLSINPF